MQYAPNNLRLIWADKIVLTLAVLILIVAVFGWVLFAIAAGTAGANHVLASVGLGGTLGIIAVLFAVWATFRATDFAAGGATYQLFHAAPVEDAPVLPVTENLLAH
jgi:hypothetical protein